MADEPTRASVVRRYDRIARFDDAFEAPMDLLGGRRRRARCVAGATGRTLEVGIGTGRNLDLYPEVLDLTGIDISPAMLARAGGRARALESSVRLEVADTEDLPYPDSTFDTVCATCVFCSVPDPIVGFRELARVTRPHGQIRLLDHVRPGTRLFGWIADRLSPLTEHLIGPAVNRRTEDNAKAAGLDLVEVRSHGVWREILARPARARDDPAPDTGSIRGGPMTSLPEALGRFARGHLHSEAEYAVYRTVGGDQAASWTADEIATHADVDVGDVHRALRRFAAARILVEEGGHGGQQRYRWRSELSYLFDGTSPLGLVDPVCGMPVEAGSPHAATDTTGAAVRFCSAWCRAAFRAGVGR